MTTDIRISEALLDEELERVARYIGREMTDAEAETFEDDLREDEAFFDRVAPMLKVWYSRAPGYTMEATRQRIREREILEQRELVAPEAVTARDSKVTPISEGRVRRVLRRMARKHFIIALASASSLAAGIATIIFRLLTSPVLPQLPSIALAPAIAALPAASAAKSRPMVAMAKVESPALPPQTVPTVIADNDGPAIDSLPAAKVKESVESDTQVKSNVAVAVQWRPSEGQSGFDPMGLLRGVGDKLGDAWDWFRHPRTKKPTASPKPPGA